MGTPTNSPLFKSTLAWKALSSLPVGSPSCLSSSLGDIQLPGKPRQSFSSQVPRSLAAKERPEAELRGVRSQDSVILLAPGNDPQRQEGWPEKETCGVAWGWEVGRQGRQQFSAARESRAGSPSQQRKQTGVSLNLRWLPSHSPLALGVSFARSLPLRSLFQSLE